MKTPTFKTKCTVRLQKSLTNDYDYYLFIEAYPVYENNNAKPKRKSTFLNRSISTIIWDKKKNTRGGNHQPKRNVEGVIQCRSKADQQSALFAAQVCAVMQDEYNKKALFPQQYKEQQEQYAREQVEVLPYIQKLIKKKEATLTSGTMRVWANFLGKYQEFEGENRLTFGEINRAKIEEFTLFIANYKSKKVEKLAANSQKSMLSRFQEVLNEAYKKDKLITFNPIDEIEMPTGEQKTKQFLTFPELQKLQNTYCPNDDVRKISLFSALTGLRHSDCVGLTWDKVTDNPPRVQLAQQKTKGNVYLPISAEALQLCGERKNENESVFELVYNHNDIIKEWVKSAGITKYITFHCFRHTYATLQLTNGTDLYTVSKMLGHKDVKTTQIYAQIVDEKKQKAANAIVLNINNEQQNEKE